MIKLTQYHGEPIWVRIDAIEGFTRDWPTYETRKDPGCYVHVFGGWLWIKESIDELRAILSAARG